MRSPAETVKGSDTDDDQKPTVIFISRLRDAVWCVRFVRLRHPRYTADARHFGEYNDRRVHTAADHNGANNHFRNNHHGNDNGSDYHRGNDHRSDDHTACHYHTCGNDDLHRNHDHRLYAADDAAGHADPSDDDYRGNDNSSCDYADCDNNAGRHHCTRYNNCTDIGSDPCQP